MASRRLDLEGKRFTRLVVTKFIDRDKFGAARWECLCDCGNYVVVRSGSLISGNSKSCGCLQKDAISERSRKDNGAAAFKSVYNNYIYRARRKCYTFSLTEQEFMQLTRQNCFYCGSPPSNVERSNYQNGDFVYNGIDRLDNTLGYEFSNCVSCCKVCNRAKNDLPLSQFKEWVDRIHARLNSS